MLFVAFVVVSGIQLYFYLKYFFPLSKHKSSQSSTEEKGVSIIVAAKNEAHVIENCLNQLFKQSYPTFEVIVINDYSEDDTLSILNLLTYSNLTVLNNNVSSGKKSAITQGIKSAKHELLLFTDADCLPNSERWILEMVKNFSKEKEIVLGFGGFNKRGGILNKLIRFEGFIVALQYFGFALAGNSYMGVGRNLAYKKSIFNAVNGFAEHNAVLSGDDDLFVNQVGNATNVAIVLDEVAHTLTKGERTWKRFIHQKRRQLVAGAHYKKSDKVRLALYGATSFLYYCLFVTLLVVTPINLVIIGIFVLKQFLEYYLFKRIAERLKVDDLLPYLSILEPLYILSLTTIGVSTWFWKVKQWK